MSLTVVCLSDTHNKLDQVEVPEGDVLIHAGDATMMGTNTEAHAFNRALGRLPHRHKLVIAGNHDWGAWRNQKHWRNLLSNATYLQDELVVVEGMRVWGSPWQPEFCNWAFNVPRGRALKEKWDLIPPCDVLVTHGPPKGYLDATDRGVMAGCEDLIRAVERVKPRHHVFGHIHEGYGVVGTLSTLFMNASSCDENYRPVNPPLTFEWRP